MRIARHLTLGAIAVLGACYRYTPPAAPVPRQGTPVTASFGRTWDAVIDVFAERNIPIRTIERSSGFIATENLKTPYEPRSAKDRRDVKADCGHEGALVYTPTHAVYNIVVRGDSAHATVRATVAWVSIVDALKGETYECSTTGLWEGRVEADIRDRAEGVRATPAFGSPGAPAPSARPVVASQGSDAIPVPVTIRVRVPDWVADPAPIADFPLILIGPRGDTTAVRTNGRGEATASLPPGRYRVMSLQLAGAKGSPHYGWDVLVDVKFSMPPVVLDQRNAGKRSP